MAKEFPTELLNKYYSEAVELCDAETSMFCYFGRLTTGLHTMHCSRFASKVKSKCKELAMETVNPLYEFLKESK